MLADFLNKADERNFRKELKKAIENHNKNEAILDSDFILGYKIVNTVIGKIIYFKKRNSDGKKYFISTVSVTEMKNILRKSL